MVLAARDWLASEELGNRFDDVRLLRAGSRFTIYEGRETQAHRTVVIKVPDDHSASWLHDVLDHEAAVLSAISSHPHVITLFQRFRLDDGRPALLLEHCDHSLADTLRDGDRMSLQSAISTGIKLAGALETLHHAGFLHCDVRPSNILVSEWGEPLLAGFDESVHIGSATGRAPLHVTTAHTALELLEGQEPTVRSDVYGLASTLYELVAGRAAFGAYVGESPATVIVRVLSGRVKPIVAPDVPLEISDLLTWGMSADPARRPPSPAWIAEELGRMERRQGWPRTRMISG
ncbi:MAG: serine/threonine-protein kinase PknK [Pseudonocardiales bacterium]|nr:serine/threonine-protein kinase PknK [Pseudonocardiales bacterium]